MVKRYVDEFDNIHVLDKEIGRGGQGLVYRTRDADVAVKILTDAFGAPVTNEKLNRRYRRQLELVSTLPMPPQLPIAAPVANLRDVSGYVMRLLENMVPFSDLQPSRKYLKNFKQDKVPKWLSSAPPEGAALILHYRDLGGLRHRLAGLYKCSAILSRIHGHGLVYGDLSPNNAFISGNGSDCEVWLIDADNLRFASIKSTNVVYTQGFGAPELVKGEDGVRPRTDCHSFAVMAFKTLTLNHPFIGDYVKAGAGTDWADEDFDLEDPEQKAYAGKIPWIDDEDDGVNRSSEGFSRPLVLTKELQALFQETFGPGRKKPWRRPSIFHWPKTLARALDRTILCQNGDCGMNYYVDLDAKKQRCPFCNLPRPDMLRVDAFRWEGPKRDLGAPCWSLCKESSADGVEILPDRLISSFSMRESDRPALELTFNREVVVVKNVCPENEVSFSFAHDTNGEDRFQNFPFRVKRHRKDCQGGFYIFAESNSSRLLRFSLPGKPK